MMQKGKIQRKILEFLLTLIIPVLLLLLWEVLAANGGIKETIMPRPSKIGSTLWELTWKGKLPYDIGISLRRVLIGYVSGSMFGILVGIVLGLFPKINVLLKLLVEILRPFPLLPGFLSLFYG